MTILVIADIINDELSSDQTGKTVSAVSGLGKVTILCACKDAEHAGKAAAKFEGVSKVLTASNELFADGLAEPMASLIVSLSESYDYIILMSVNKKNQFNRIKNRKNMSYKLFNKILKNQISNTKKRFAHFVINNNHSKIEKKKKLKIILNKILSTSL